MKIIWTEFATEELKKIYLYYKDKASLVVAKKIKLSIIDAPDVLKKFPSSGKEEENLKSLKQGHRYLITNNNFKLIYLVMEKAVFITDVFDCRQDPQKIKQRNK